MGVGRSQAELKKKFFDVYSIMINEETMDELRSMSGKVGTLSVCRKVGSKYFHLWKSVMDFTHFLPEETPFKVRFHYAVTGMSEPKKCGCGCGEILANPKSEFISGHGNRSAIVKERKKQAFLDRHGVENPSQLQSVKDAKKATSMER